LANLTEATVYTLCVLASALCAALLWLGFLRSRSRLLMWMTVSFMFLALGNLGAVIGLFAFPDVSVWYVRKGPALIGVGVLIYALVWELER
jgi:hypothetical protein